MSGATLEVSSPEGWARTLERLLEPLTEGRGMGEALRHGPLYQAIQDARREDDASVPQGEWERPLAKGDWPRVVELCVQALDTQGKDLQVAAWLCEAACRAQGVGGLVEGLRLLLGLCERYWEGLWPLLEPDDADARCAPFVWADGALARACVLHLPLWDIPGSEPTTFTLDDWRRLQARPARGAQDDEDAASERPIERLLQQAKAPAHQAALRAFHQEVGEAQSLWRRLDALLSEHLGFDAPAIRQLSAQLETLAALCTQLGPPVAATNSDQSGDPGADRVAREPVTGAALAGGLDGREAAYRQLAVIADYLTRIEPHSPTPHLLRRAIDWGRMDLAALVSDMEKEEGGVMRVLQFCRAAGRGSQD